MDLSIEYLKSLVSYDPETGLIHALVRLSQRRVAGALMGGSDGHGYVTLSVRGHKIRAHRLAFAFMAGRWPSEIDHVNGVRSDNRWRNLREVVREVNMQNIQRAQSNNRSGLLGVTRSGSKFMASIYAGKKHYLGTFDTPEKAHESYIEAKRKLHPEANIIQCP